MSLSTGVVIVTHGDAAQAMVEAAERMVGGLDVRTLPVRIGEPRADTESRLKAVVATLGTEEVLFLTDLEGATPFNLCCKRCSPRHGAVLSGMNLAMLFKLATADRQHGAVALAEELRATGLKSIHIRTPNHDAIASENKE